MQNLQRIQILLSCSQNLRKNKEVKQGQRIDGKDLGEICFRAAIT